MRIFFFVDFIDFKFLPIKNIFNEIFVCNLFHSNQFSKTKYLEYSETLYNILMHSTIRSCHFIEFITR